jgi:fructokinase
MRIGVDLGGTKIEVAALDARGNIVCRIREKTPQRDYDATLNKIATLVNQVERKVGRVCSVGVGLPGSISKLTGRLKNANSTCLNGRSFKEDIERLLKRAVKIANDANCFALSEAIDGAGANKKVVFGVILGTGVGGGLVINQQLVEGANSIAGEWGHNPLAWGKEDKRALLKCYCGRKGCIETFLSGPGLSAQHELRAGISLAAESIFDAAEKGDLCCNESLSVYEEQLARALASVINIMDPDVIILGGGLSNGQRLYENVPVLWKKHIFSDYINTVLLPANFGDSSGVRGAARLNARLTI